MKQSVLYDYQRTDLSARPFPYLFNVVFIRDGRAEPFRLILVSDTGLDPRCPASRRQN